LIAAPDGGNGREALVYYRIDAQIILWSHSADVVKTFMTSNTTYTQQNKLWLENTRWLYIITGMPFGEGYANNYHYNPTMTLTKDGVDGLPLNVNPGDEALTDAQIGAYANQFIAGLTNKYNGSAGTSFSWGTGIFTTSGSYSGGTNNNGVILWRGNLNYELPAPDPVPEDDGNQDMAEDIFGDGMVDVSGFVDAAQDIFTDDVTGI